MAELARGKVSDRPWGRTLGALALRGLSGQLTVNADGKAYCVAFAQGTVVGASSPLATDAAVRLALTSGLVSPTQVNDIARRMAAAPGRDDVDLLVEVARLAPEHAPRLRRRLVAQRAARTFAVERGEFVVEDRVTVQVVPGNELDIRTIIYMGARANLSDERLAAEVLQMGVWFKLKPEAIADLPQFGFTETEKPVLSKLLGGANLDEILAVAIGELDNRAARSILYALVSCNAVEVSATPRTASGFDISPPSDPPTVVNRAPSRELRARSHTRPSEAPPISNHQLAQGVNVRSPPGTAPPQPRAKPPTQPPPVAPPPVAVAPPPPRRRAARSTAAHAETEKLIGELVPLLEQGADHFALLGVAHDAPSELVRSSYFNLARKLHPDRLAALGIDDPARHAQQLFAQINTAFAVLGDPSKREEYELLLKRGGEAAVRADDNRAEELAMRVMRAEESFKQGEMALRRDQLALAIQAFSTAVELQPQEPEYQALLAWTKFAAAPDKNAVAAQTRKDLQRAADAGERSPAARFYLGRVERMLGREKEALALFQEALRIKPGHSEAAAEVRVLEQRLKGRR